MFKLRLSLIALVYVLAIEASAQKKTSVMPVFYIVFLQLSLLNFSLCLVAHFKALSNSSLRTNNESICIFLSFFLSLFVSFVWRCAGCCRSLSQKEWGRTLLIACYRSLSPTYPLQPLLQIGWSSSSCSSF